jgi:peptidoglycan/LPS O-acetylase OafA/YrhL
MASKPDRTEAAGRREPVAFVPALEGLRGFAALLVVVYHCWLLTLFSAFDQGPGRALISTGFFGLNFFFVLSGFVLFLPTVLHSGEFGSVGGYAARRVARIVPAYYLVIAIGLAALPLIATNLDAARDSINFASVAAHLTLTQTEARMFHGYHGALGFTINPVLWTLSVEAAFYVVLPLVAKRYFARPLIGLAIAVIASAGLRYAVVHGAFDLSLSGAHQALSLFPLFACDFAAGMTGAALYVRLRDSDRAKRLAPLAVAMTLAALIGLMLVAGSVDARDVRPHARDSVALSTLIPLAFGALALALTLAPKRLQWPATNPAARFAGRVSYGTYLFHFLVIGFAFNTLGFARDGSNASFYELTALVLPVSMALGWLSYVAVEQPSRRLVRRRLVARRERKQKQPIAAAPVVSPHRSPA